MMTRRLIIRGVLGFTLLLAVGGAAAWWLSWRSPPYFTDYGEIDLPTPVMTSEEYDKVLATHARPFLVERTTAEGALLLYGSSHTKKPDDPQFADIRRRWEEFRPTIALVEGRPGGFLAGLSDPVKAFGEMGFVYGLAREHGVRTYSWEPPMGLEVANVLGRHSKERVALFYVLRPYFSNLRHGKPADPEKFVEEYRRQRTRLPGLEGTLASIQEIDAVWRRDFADRPDWRDTSDEHGLPGYLHEVWKSSNSVRDEHFARVIVHLVRRGNRVFAAAGSSHAVKLEPALAALLK